MAHDPDKQEWGVAVASRALAVGAVVPFARAGVGAVATQARVNIAHGPHGVELLAKGMSADEALKKAKELGAQVHADAFDVMDVGRMGVVQDPQVL